ncbi:thiamine pyrophosphate-binding protein [Acidisoma cellulosilytica]|uniref:Thiamine pyrophosphate-binding protein n=1 Tax=Acidisoma cellulosilyticum TaxID=2802395 RepID=A0A963YYT9_9PROT|nr:thiamine pyrophosphate-binding protein [Acidisoma cellulosilyticum]MCB8878862.1 thiamine pyrophosphate-binding protein [Acidisoma cellulosilyticum]
MTLPNADQRSGGQLVVDCLEAQGVDHIFCVPGESFLAVLDALHGSKIAVTVCRQEGGATMMADAVGRLTGRPGIAMVTRGPGATNASPAIHIAEHDSVPLILFVGQVARGMRGRGAFQEMDFKAVFGSMAKWVVEIDDAARIPEIISRAFHIAMQGRPGPVVIALPEDMLRDKAEGLDLRRIEPVEIAPSVEQLAGLQSLLAEAENPVLLLGGAGWAEDSIERLRGFIERFDLPVFTTFRRATLLSGDHPNYGGELGLSPNPKLRARIAASDLVLMFGTRLAEIPSQGYTLFEIPQPRQRMVHIHADAAELGRVYHPTLAIQATAGGLAQGLDALSPARDIPWRDATRQARADFLAWTEVAPKLPGDLQYGEIMVWLRDRLPADAIVTNGAGNYTIWVQRFLRFRSFGSQLAPVSGSMGYGLPAAVGAKRAQPDRLVVSFAGDGCFLMNGQEFATAVQYDLPIIVIIVDNGMYGTIRMHQERHYPGRVSATHLKNPDFAAYARAFGGYGERVERTDDFQPAFERAIESGLPSIIHLILDPEALTPGASLSKIRGTASRL